MSPLEREVELLEEDLEQGNISEADYNNALRDLYREADDYAREVGDRAYRDELERM